MLEYKGRALLILAHLMFAFPTLFKAASTQATPHPRPHPALTPLSPPSHPPLICSVDHAVDFPPPFESLSYRTVRPHVAQVVE